MEFYDCITNTSLPYCRRPPEPIALRRDQSVWHCDHNGTSHSFSALFLKNISVSIVLHQWNSSVEKAEQYSRYKKQRQSTEVTDNQEGYLCECKDPQSFGKHCEYLLPMGTTFQETIAWEVEMRRNNTWDMQRYSDIVCYTTLICNSGLLCLDWRDICDGIQHCMYGYDEENCDKLELNECEDDEYRCVNGMCIPDEYFLDGEYDCLDLTDETEPFDDERCPNGEVTSECDDRMCLRSYWSCGDGQCIENRVAFHSGMSGSCRSRREQYHMCELQYWGSQWTLPNGKCYRSVDYKENLVENRTTSNECIYLIKCALSQGGEKDCPCGRRLPCLDEIKNSCTSPIVEYPQGAILGPYVFLLYKTARYWTSKTPDRTKVAGSIKCRGYMARENTTLEYSPKFSLPGMEVRLCASEGNTSVVGNDGYDQFCYNNSRTFNNRSYHFLDVCEDSKECISAYRISDGSRDCLHGMDEPKDNPIVDSCSKIQRHRFRCSNERSSCLPVSKLAERSIKCEGDRADWWMEILNEPEKFACNTKSKKDCALFRQFIEESGRIDQIDHVDRQIQLTKIPFRFFCDTFWDWPLKKDEDISMCKIWWRCPQNQWQCRSGQCINIEWVLDGEWDCVDASDEEGLFLLEDRFFRRNINLTDMTALIKEFDFFYKEQPFRKFCNLTIEYPCLRSDVSDPLNITQNRPCIDMDRIGDDHVDCLGGLDERNTLKDCDSSSMLGYQFWCSRNEMCIPLGNGCLQTCDERLRLCDAYEQTSNCSEYLDFTCWDGTCVKRGLCSTKYDCSHGEDELFCLERKAFVRISAYNIYRLEKKISLRSTKQTLYLSQISLRVNEKQIIPTAISMRQSELTPISSFKQVNSSIPYNCNRGIGVYLVNKSIVCFCPPQYYGEKCQFHNDRITVLFHLNLSQSIYVESNNNKMVLQLLIIFLYENDPLMTESFQIQIADQIKIPRKKLLHLFYSRLNASLACKRTRYFNRSNIINEHPYSIRFELYELSLSERARLIGVWLYPLYFDFLPSFRLAKVLHLIKSDRNKNPCSSNPCSPEKECYPLLNEKSHYVCLCPADYKEDNCSIKDQMCEEGYCSLNGLCKPTYRGLLAGNERPYCICPLNKIGDRCDLVHDQCDPNPCQNNGRCLSTAEPNRFFCLCDNFHYGDQCQLVKRSIRLELKQSLSYRAVTVQYFDINFYSLELVLVHQNVFIQLPDVLHYVYDTEIAPAIVIGKFYSDRQNEVYLISVHINVQSINGTRELNGNYQCPHVQTLFPTKEEISPYKYHHLCNENSSLLCFVDEIYLCICEENHARSECFISDDKLDQCSYCLAGGQCLKEGRWRSDFLCLCPKCYYGSLCQFSIEGVSFTLDSLFIQIDQNIQLIYFGFAFGLFLIGGIFNSANAVTFKRANLRRTSIGIYLFVLSLIGQYSLFSLVMKIILIVWNSLMTDISCKIISSLHSISIRSSFWLTSWIAIERVTYVLFPFATLLKKVRVAKIISFVTILIIALMHIHDVIFYIKITDSNGQGACVVDFPSKVRTYDRLAVLIHYLIPFSIQILSITVLIILAARSRSRAINNGDTYLGYLKRQFQSKKELYIPALIIVFSGLPQTILSFSFACLKLIIWQQHALLIAYFLSFAPQFLTFVLFVLPSTNYMKEFRLTKLSRTVLFRWISSSKET